MRWIRESQKYRNNIERAYKNRYFAMEEADKSRFIDRNIGLTDEEKDEIKSFFRSHPNYENKIDWNSRWTYQDFEKVRDMAASSRSNTRKKGNGLLGLEKGYDYLVLGKGIFKDEPWIAYQPLTWKGSRILASNAVPPVRDENREDGGMYSGARWCIAYQKGSDYWKGYSIDNGESFIFVFGESIPTKKVALECGVNKWNDIPFTEIWNYDDVSNTIEMEELPPEVRDLPRVARKNHSLLERIHKEQLKREEEEMAEILDLLGKGGFPDSWIFNGSVYVPENYRKKISGRVMIPEGVTNIDSNGFEGCKLLKEVILPSTVRSIGIMAFKDCENLLRIDLPKGIEKIEMGAFFWCERLPEIDIPEGVKSIGSSAFQLCESLRKVSFPSTLKEVGPFAFKECRDLEKVDFSGCNLKSAGQCIFKDCISLISADMGNSLESIGNEAFSGCKSLTSVKMPDGLDISPMTFVGSSIHLEVNGLPLLRWKKKNNL